MKRITRNAGECNVISTATIKNTTFNESIPLENVFIRDGEKKQDKTHGFSRGVAEFKNPKGETLGDNAAIILRYLSAITRKYGRKIEGKTWVRVNLDHISKQYPYLGRSTVDESVLRLQQFGCCELKNAEGALKSRKNDRTRCYHIPTKWMDAAEEEPRYFSSAAAEDVKVPAAVIYYNFCHWIGECQEKGVVEHVKLAPATLIELLPFSKSTIKRAIQTLVSRGYIHDVPGEQCWYAVGTRKSGGSKADESGSKADEPGSKADESGSKADNYIDCNKLTDVLEMNSKEKPAASSLEYSSTEPNDTDDEIIRTDESIATFSDEQDRKVMTHGKTYSPFSNIVSFHDASLISTEKEANSFVPSLIPAKEETPCFVFSQEPIVPSTVLIDGAAGDGNGKWPIVSSLESLHLINKHHREMADIIEKDYKSRKMYVDTVHRICSFTWNILDPDKCHELYENEDSDSIINMLMPHYHQVMNVMNLDPVGPLFDMFYYGALECLVGAFLWPKDGKDSYSHPFYFLIPITHELYLKLWRVAEDKREEAVRQEFADMKRAYASADEHKEDDSSLSPAEKMRVFRNGLNSRNKVGWIFYDQTHRINQITSINKPALKLVQRLFEHNADATPSVLLSILDGCMSAFANQPAPKKLESYVDFYETESQKWYARMGHDLLFFVTNLHTIVNQLGVRNSCGIETFLCDLKKVSSHAGKECEMAA